MFNLALSLYFLSLICQALAAMTAISLIKVTKNYRNSWLLLAIALTLMLGRRILPINDILNGDPASIEDEFLSVPISLFIFLGVLSLRKLFKDMQEDQSVLESSSKMDALTNCFNKAETMHQVAQEIERSYRTGKKIALLLIDIDQFKKVNDQYGHLVGDDALKTISKNFRKNLRNLDTLGRVGGEEFLIALPDIESQTAVAKADQIRLAIKESTDFINSDIQVKVTVSIGVVVFDPKAEGSRAWPDLAIKYFARADAAMYEAKKLGRDQVHLWNPA